MLSFQVTGRKSYGTADTLDGAKVAFKAEYAMPARVSFDSVAAGLTVPERAPQTSALQPQRFAFGTRMNVAHPLRMLQQRAPLRGIGTEFIRKEACDILARALGVLACLEAVAAGKAPEIVAEAIAIKAGWFVLLRGRRACEGRQGERAGYGNHINSPAGGNEQSKNMSIKLHFHNFP